MAEVFEFVEEAFDLIALWIERLCPAKNANA
jgi:hypothetical protein